MRQLAEADARGDVGEVVFAADEFDIHAVETRAHDALQAVLLGELGLALVVEHERAALDGGDVFVGVKTERDEVTEGADAFAVPLAAEGLGGVLDDAEVVLLRDGVEAVAVDGQAGEIDGDDGARGRSDGGFDAGEVEVAGDGVDVDEHGLGADIEDDVAGGDPGERRGNDLVARADAGDAQRDFHRAGAGVEHAHGAAAAILGEFRLEGLHVGAGSNPAGAEHLGDAGDGGIVDGRTRERQIGQGGRSGGHLRVDC